MVIPWRMLAAGSLFLAAGAAAQSTSQGGGVSVPPPESPGEYPARFEVLDADGDGYISQEEAAENPHLVENWLELDRDESGRLDRSEFSAFEKIFLEEETAPEASGSSPAIAEGQD